MCCGYYTYTGIIRNANTDTIQHFHWMQIQSCIAPAQLFFIERGCLSNKEIGE